MVFLTWRCLTLLTCDKYLWVKVFPARYLISLSLSPYLQFWVLGSAPPCVYRSNWDISSQHFRVLSEERDREAPTHGRGDHSGCVGIQLGQEGAEVFGLVLHSSCIFRLPVPFEPDRNVHRGCTYQLHKAQVSQSLARWHLSVII